MTKIIHEQYFFVKNLVYKYWYFRAACILPIYTVGYRNMEHRLKLKRIGVLYLGGLTRRFRSSVELTTWMSDVHEWRMLARLDGYLAGGQWYKVVREIVAGWKRCDGFVVILPEEGYYAESQRIAHMLGAVGKPIVYVSVSRSTHADDPQFRVHMINALHTVIQDVAGHLTVQSHAAVPLIEYAQENPTHIYGYFDFGFRLVRGAPKRHNGMLDVPRLKPLAHIATDMQDAADAYIVNGIDTKSVPAPTLVCHESNAYVCMPNGQKTVVSSVDIESMHAQFAWAVQKGLEAGDMSDIPGDMSHPRIDHERI